MTNWSIRSARFNDAPPLTACIRAAYARYDGLIAGLPDVAGGIAEDIADNLVFVAVENGTVIGGLVLVEDGKQMVLANVAVDPDHGGKGLGRALILRAHQEAAKRNIRNLVLSTHADMPENVAMYQHLGWQTTGRTGNKIHMSCKVVV